MDGPPPPPPPHGANPNTTDGTPKYRKSTDLPDGPYDIFVIPPHSAGSGFIYLPSLQCHRNSFIAGSLFTLLVVALWTTLQPMVKSWVATTNPTGGVGVIILIMAVGFGGWYFGTMQGDGGPNGSTENRFRPGGGFGAGYQYNAHQNQNGAFPGGGPTSGSQYNGGSQYNTGGPPPQPPPHHHHNAHANTAPNDDAKKADAEWERAREETKRKEEIRRKMEAYKKKREEEEMKKRREKEREAMEKELQERKEQLEKEAAAARAAAEKELRERAEREAAEREEKARKEAAEKEAAAKEAAKKEAAARFAAAKDAAAKKFAAAKEAAAAKAKTKTASGPASSSSAAPPPPPQPQPPPPPRTPSPQKPQKPSAADDDAYSFRPYDRPRRPYGASAPSVYSESSYAPSQSTARTTPPPSQRGPYTTKDPDKVILRGVYAFNNAFQKTPLAQLVSGQGSVTDGLVLKITTEGWFVDDDVRGVAQREWDVKAWTIKLIESVDIQSLHIVRASLRDQEGKKYLFVLDKNEAWKVTHGLQRLRRGSQVRSMNMSGLPVSEGKAVLSNLGYI